MRFIDLVRRRQSKTGATTAQVQVPSESPLTLSLAPYSGEPPLKVDSDALAPISHVLVHGSIATHDACPFSDVDVAVIVDDRRPFTPEQHAEAVQELRRLLDTLFSYDGLMHHGLMFFPASGLYAYDQRFLPIRTLELAGVLHGPLEIEVWEAPEPAAHFAQTLRSSAQSLLRHFIDRTFCINDFLFKQVLSGTLLMPARVLAAHGTHVYKRDSFEPAREYFSAKSWELVARAEALRSAWIRPPRSALDRAMTGRVHPYLRTQLSRRASSTLNVRRLSANMIAGMEKSAKAFVERIEELL
jgi:hypothetical protein